MPARFLCGTRGESSKNPTFRPGSGPGGGGRGTRTPDLYSAIVALSQLSYAPWRLLASIRRGARDRQSRTAAAASPRPLFVDPGSETRTERNPHDPRFQSGPKCSVPSDGCGIFGPGRQLKGVLHSCERIAGVTQLVEC